MPMVKERLRRATAMSAPSLAMPCRRRSGRTALFFVAFIRSHKIDLKWLKVHFKIPYGYISEFLRRDAGPPCGREVAAGRLELGALAQPFGTFCKSIGVFC